MRAWFLKGHLWHLGGHLATNPYGHGVLTVPSVLEVPLRSVWNCAVKQFVIWSGLVDVPRGRLCRVFLLTSLFSQDIYKLYMLYTVYNVPYWIRQNVRFDLYKCMVFSILTNLAISLKGKLSRWPTLLPQCYSKNLTTPLCSQPCGCRRSAILRGRDGNIFA